jgi:hypothetical protein
MFKSKKKRWTRHAALGRHRRRWNDNIKMVLRVIEWDVMDWIDLAEDRDCGGLL